MKRNGKPFTILELKWEKSKFRFMLLNLGFEI